MDKELQGRITKRQVKITKWVREISIKGYETTVEEYENYLRAKEEAFPFDGRKHLLNLAEEENQWEKIHDEEDSILETKIVFEDITEGDEETDPKEFGWSDELVAQFALDYTRGSYGTYSGCKSAEEKLERFKEIYKHNSDALAKNLFRPIYEKQGKKQIENEVGRRVFEEVDAK